jgi:hypothetical protein
MKDLLMSRNLNCLLMVAGVALATASSAQADYVSAVLADNPVLYYRLQEAGVADTDPALNSATTGTTYNGTYTFASAGSITDAVGPTVDLDPAKQFTPGNGYIDVPGGFGGSATSAFSIEFFIRPDSNTFTASGIRALYASDDWGSGRFHLNLQSGTGNVELAMFDNPDPSWPVFNLGAWAPVGEWTHFALTYEVSGSDYTAVFYTNGVERLNTTVAGTGTVNFDAIGSSIGAWMNSGTPERFVSGGLDEFAIYDYALSAGDVASHYAAVPEPSSMALLAVGGVSAWILRRRRRT